jgi:cytochrome c553
LPRRFQIGIARMLRKPVLPTLVVAFAVTGATNASAQDTKAGLTLVKQKCQTCHGVDGIAKIPVAPHLAGENEIYLQTQLKAFRSGRRSHEMMSVVARELSDQDIANASAWFASIKITVEVPQ